MPFIEHAHDFGSITANTPVQFSIDETFRGNASVPASARITYAIVRNNLTASVTVQGPRGSSVVAIGERKRIEMAGGARFFTILSTVSGDAGLLTADVGVEGVTL